MGKLHVALTAGMLVFVLHFVAGQRSSVLRFALNFARNIEVNEAQLARDSGCKYQF